MSAVVRLDGTQPVRYGLKVDMDEKYRALKEGLADLCGLATSSLMLVEVFGALVRVRRGERRRGGEGGMDGQKHRGWRGREGGRERKREE